MRTIVLGAMLFGVLGCGPKTEEPSKSPAEVEKPKAAAQSFEDAFRAGTIAWQPVRNIQLATTSGGTQTLETFDFTTKLKYDDSGRPSEDTAGQKTYSWPNREATFGADAVIKISEEATVREGVLHVGDEWIWTGQEWKAKSK